MEIGMINFSSNLLQRQAVSQVELCNDFTMNFGLTLTHLEAVELVETRSLSLKSNGRIEFGGGAIDKIIFEFCDSPFLTTQNYADTLNELVAIFYYYKNETLDLMSDEDLIGYMKKYFDGICQGSLELLCNRELNNMARNLRFGKSADYSEDSEVSEEEIEEETENEQY